jgi:YidC/Oxa1 family membrane protein insertase
VDRNFFLAFALSFLVLVFWTMWQAERRQEQIPQGEEIARDVAPAPDGFEAPKITPPEERPARGPTQPHEIPDATPPAVKPPAREETVEIVTPLFTAELTNRGGGLKHWYLERYHDASQLGRPRVELTTPAPPLDVALATPFHELGLGDLSRAPYRLDRPGEYRVDFTRSAAGVVLRKRYSFDPDSYVFRLRLEVENGSSRVLEPRFEVAWPAAHRESPDFADQMLLVLNEGSVERVPVAGVGGAGFFSRLFGGGKSDGGPVLYDGEVEWAGAQTRYFLQVLLPDVPREAQARFAPIQLGESAASEVAFRPVRVPPGQRLEKEYRVYIGPKEFDRLEALGSSLERSIDLGWSWVAPLTRAFNWLLRACYAVIPNYGVAIILITLLVRLGTAPLMAKQMRSMKRMGELQPKIKALQQQYGDDRQRQSQEMMKLYRESGVNPLGGCFPMLIQLPVFIGLFYALRSSIDLRQEPFMLWIDDLSAPESLFELPGLGIPVRVLPLLMGASMVLQQKLTPTSMDPAQARMMMTVMPVMFTVLFYQFPSGLVLYWFVSNLLGIVHQLWVNRSLSTGR